MLMKIPEEVIKSKGIAYNQKYPYGEMSRVTKNHDRECEHRDSDAQLLGETRERHRAEARIKSHTPESTHNGQCHYR